MPWKIQQATQDVVIVYMDSNSMNVMNGAFLSDCEEALDRLERQYPLCNVVFTGNDRVFSAGLDLEILKGSFKVDINPLNHPMAWSNDERADPRYKSSLPLRSSPKELNDVAKYIQRVDALGWRLFKYPRKTVAAINGHAIAAGTLLAAACDIRVVDAGVAGRSLIGLNEVLNGFQIPYKMQLVCMQAFANQQMAKQLILSGQLITAEQARDPAFGFIHEIVGGDKVKSALDKKTKVDAFQQIYPLKPIKTQDDTFLSPLLARAVSIAQINNSTKSTAAYAVIKTTMNEDVIRKGEEDDLQTIKHLYALWAYQFPDKIFPQNQNDDSMTPPKKLLGKL